MNALNPFTKTTSDLQGVEEKIRAGEFEVAPVSPSTIANITVGDRFDHELALLVDSTGKLNLKAAELLLRQEFVGLGLDPDLVTQCLKSPGSVGDRLTSLASDVKWRGAKLVESWLHNPRLTAQELSVRTGLSIEALRQIVHDQLLAQMSRAAKSDEVLPLADLGKKLGVVITEAERVEAGRAAFAAILARNDRFLSDLRENDRSLLRDLVMSDVISPLQFIADVLNMQVRGIGSLDNYTSTQAALQANYSSKLLVELVDAGKVTQGELAATQVGVLIACRQAESDPARKYKAEDEPKRFRERCSYHDSLGWTFRDAIARLGAMGESLLANELAPNQAELDFEWRRLYETTRHSLPFLHDLEPIARWIGEGRFPGREAELRAMLEHGLIRAVEQWGFQHESGARAVAALEGRTIARSDVSLTIELLGELGASKAELLEKVEEAYTRSAIRLLVDGGDLVGETIYRNVDRDLVDAIASRSPEFRDVIVDGYAHLRFKYSDGSAPWAAWAKRYATEIAAAKLHFELPDLSAYGEDFRRFAQRISGELALFARTQRPLSEFFTFAELNLARGEPHARTYLAQLSAVLDDVGWTHPQAVPTD